jgi:hypothetical protein
MLRPRRFKEHPACHSSRTMKLGRRHRLAVEWFLLIQGEPVEVDND